MQSLKTSGTAAMTQHQQLVYCSGDFHWKWTGGEQNKLELSEFDVKLQDRWNAAVDAGCFAYKLDDIEARIVPGKYQVFVQLNEMRFNKRRQPQRMSSVSQPFNPENFNFTKVQSKEVLLELCPEQRLSLGDHHLIIINNSPLEFGHSLIIPSVNSCLPQVCLINNSFICMSALLYFLLTTVFSLFAC